MLRDDGGEVRKDRKVGAWVVWGGCGVGRWQSEVR